MIGDLRPARRDGARREAVQSKRGYLMGGRPGERCDEEVVISRVPARGGRCHERMVI